MRFGFELQVAHEHVELVGLVAAIGGVGALGGLLGLLGLSGHVAHERQNGAPLFVELLGEIERFIALFLAFVLDLLGLEYHLVDPLLAVLHHRRIFGRLLAVCSCCCCCFAVVLRLPRLVKSAEEVLRHNLGYNFTHTHTHTQLFGRCDAQTNTKAKREKQYR